MTITKDENQFLIWSLIWSVVLNDLIITALIGSTTSGGIYDLVLLIMLLKLIVNNGTKSTIEVLYSALLVIYILCTASLLSTTFLAVFAKLWVTFRFVILYAFIGSFCSSAYHKIKIVKMIQRAAIFSVSIGLLQILNAPLSHDLFTLTLGEPTLGEMSTTKGFFQYGVHLAFFLLSAELVTAAYKKPNKYEILWRIIVLYVIYMSGSRIMTLMYVMLIFSCGSAKFKTYFVFISVGILTVSLFNVSGSEINNDDIGKLTGLLSAKYWEASLLTGRLGVYALGQFIFDLALLNWLFGFGFDEAALTIYFESYFSAWPALLRNNLLVGLEDAYWMYLFFNLGLVGIIGLALFYIYFRSRALGFAMLDPNVTIKEKFRIYKIINIAFLFILIGNAINQFTSSAQFALGFWLLLALIRLNKTKNDG